MPLRVILVLFTMIVTVFGVLVFHASPTDEYQFRNLAPALVAWVGLVWISMRHARDPRWWLGWLGYLIPALGLSAYLHLAFLNDWQQFASTAIRPAMLFRYLPLYASGAGAIGFAIGWIVGRSARESVSR